MKSKKIGIPRFEVHGIGRRPSRRPCAIAGCFKNIYFKVARYVLLLCSTLISLYVGNDIAFETSTFDEKKPHNLANISSIVQLEDDEKRRKTLLLL